MPRDGAGVASAVAGSNSVASNTTILSALENSLVNDLINMFNTRWPVAIGGSGAISGDNFSSLNNSTSILNNWLKDFGGTITAGGTATGLTATITQAFTAYGSGAGQLGNGTLLSLKTASAAAAGGTTLTVSATSSLGSKKVLLEGGGAIPANAWAALATIQLRYDSAYDSAAGAWVLLNRDPAPVFAAQTRNRLVNGAMQISQENGTTSGITATYFPADQWSMQFTSTGTFAVVQVASVSPAGSPNRIRLTVSVADSALGANDFLFLQQRIEGSAIADFRYGTASAVQSVLRFGFKGPAGTYSIALANNATNRSYVAQFTITAPQANTDTLQTFIIPGDTTGTWGILQLFIVLAAGSTFQTATLGAWQAGNFAGASSNTNGMATVASVFELFDAGLYLDPNSTGVAPTYEVPDPAAELVRCARYFQSITSLVNSTIGVGYQQTTTSARLSIPLVAPLCTDPTITVVGTIGNYSVRGGGAQGAVSAFAVQYRQPNELGVVATVAVAVAANNAVALAPGSTDTLVLNSRI